MAERDPFELDLAAALRARGADDYIRSAPESALDAAIDD